MTKLADSKCPQCLEEYSSTTNKLGLLMLACKNGHKWAPRPIFVKEVGTSMRCTTASCCKSFTLPYSYHELKRAYEAWHSLKDSFLDDNSQVRRIPEDVWLIYPMVVELEPKMEASHYRYTCKHLIDNNCSIYSIRPNMCKNYPYESKCKHKDCTLGENK